MTETLNLGLFKAEIQSGGWIRLMTGAAALILLPGAARGADQLSAFAALQFLDQREGAGTTAILVEMRGHRGQSQPERWEVIAHDPDSQLLTRRYSVRSNRVSDEGIPEDFYTENLPHGFINRTKLLLDSTAVFRTLNYEAQQAGIGFESVDYQLRCREYDSEPVWCLTASSRDGRVLGRVDISGESGAVLRTVWFHWNGRFRGRPEVVDSALSGKPATPVAQKYRRPLFPSASTPPATPTVPAQPGPPRATVEQIDPPATPALPPETPADWIPPSSPGGQYGAPKAEVAPAEPVPPQAVPRAGRVPSAMQEQAPPLSPPRKGPALPSLTLTPPSPPSRTVVTHPETDPVEVIPLPADE